MEILLNPLTFVYNTVFAIALFLWLAWRLYSFEGLRYLKPSYFAALNVRSLCIFFTGASLLLMTTAEVIKTVVGYSNGYLIFSAKAFATGAARSGRLLEFFGMNFQTTSLFLVLLLILPLFRSLIMDSWELRDLISVREHMALSIYALARLLIPALFFFSAWTNPVVGSYMVGVYYVIEHFVVGLFLAIFFSRIQKKFCAITESTGVMPSFSDRSENSVTQPFHHFSFLYPLYNYSKKLLFCLTLAVVLDGIAWLLLLILPSAVNHFNRSRAAVDMLVLATNTAFYMSMVFVILMIVPNPDFHIPALESDALRKHNFESLTWRPSNSTSSANPNTINDPFLRAESGSESPNMPSMPFKEGQPGLDHPLQASDPATAPSDPSLPHNVQTSIAVEKRPPVLYKDMIYPPKSPREPPLHYVFETQSGPAPFASYTASGLGTNTANRLMRIDESFEEVHV